MAALAKSDDVEIRWRPLTSDELIKVDTLLDDASAIIRARVSTVDARISAGTLDPLVAAGVAARMVIRVLRNPTGAIAKSRTIDDATVSETYDREAVRAEMYVPDADLALLAPADAGTAFTIRPAYVDPVTGTWAAT